MKDPSKTYCQATSNPSPSATSSPESASGPMPSDKPDGPTIEKSGPEVVHANLSARQAKELGLLTSGTYGPRFITSFGSVRLEQSLVSRLRAKTASLGSALFRLTWKQRDTPLGVSIYALRASARRTSDKDCTSWLTPNTPSGGPNVKPSAKHTGGMDLEGAATLAPWSTPRANKWGFPDAHGSDERPMAGWPTTTRDWKDGSECPNVPLNSLLGRVAWLTDSGKTLSGSSAETKSSGQLNPGLPRWLQGLPTAWESCADMVTPLRRQSRKVSSKPI
jgi:hypothetical protein